VILDAKTLKPLFEGRESRHWIRDVRFSPDGKFFAVASMDHKIYLYNRDTFRLKGSCDRHNSYVQSLDYSADSIYIQSDSGDYEHLYYEAEDGEYFAAGSRLKDIQWHEWTCTYGWPVQGIWPPNELVTKGKAFDPTSCHRSKDQTTLVSGDSNGVVKLTKWPCTSKDAEFAAVKGHVGEVARVRYTCDGSHVVSIGKMDRCINIWRVVKSNMFD
jgi:WD40 repeat protein